MAMAMAVRPKRHEALRIVPLEVRGRKGMPLERVPDKRRSLNDRSVIPARRDGSLRTLMTREMPVGEIDRSLTVAARGGG